MNNLILIYMKCNVVVLQSDFFSIETRIRRHIQDKVSTSHNHRIPDSREWRDFDANSLHICLQITKIILTNSWVLLMDLLFSFIEPSVGKANTKLWIGFTITYRLSEIYFQLEMNCELKLKFLFNGSINKIEIQN